MDLVFFPANLVSKWTGLSWKLTWTLEVIIFLVLIFVLWVVGVVIVIGILLIFIVIGIIAGSFYGSSKKRKIAERIRKGELERVTFDDPKPISIQNFQLAYNNLRAEYKKGLKEWDTDMIRAKYNEFLKDKNIKTKDESGAKVFALHENGGLSKVIMANSSMNK